MFFQLTFLANTLLQTTVTGETPDLVLDDRKSVLVVSCSHVLIGDGESDGVGNTLTEKTGGQFDTWELDLGVASSNPVHGRGMVLLDLVKGPRRISRKMKHDVLKQARVASREHESYRFQSAQSPIARLLDLSESRTHDLG